MGGGGWTRRIAALRRRSDDQAGQGLIEYLMIIALVAIGLISLVQLLFGEVAGFFERAAAALQTMAPLK